jgi:uncharacterized LabA/DUF88 family protein
MKTIVYVDGLNLYYGAVKGTPYKWLDLSKLCQLLLPQHQIQQIKYYTAKVKARPGDLGQPVRQQTYLRALRTIPNLKIVYGQFLQSQILMPLVNPPVSGPRIVKVIKTEEKGSDVNIATHLVHDGHLGRYEAAVIVSNDSDLVEAVKIVRYELNLTVGMINPHRKPSYALKQHVNFMKKVRKGVMQASQFPPTIQDGKGIIRKPTGW